MDLSMDFINGVDIQNGVLSDKGQLLLEAYNSGEFSMVKIDTANVSKVPSSSSAPAKDEGYKSLLD